MPGLVNAHTHNGQILERGYGDRLPLDAWIIAAVYAGPRLDPRALYVLAAWSALVQLKSGCTASLDHASVPFETVDAGYDAVMQAYVDTGFRSAVAMSLGDLDFFQTLPGRLVPHLDVPSIDRPPVPTDELLAAAGRFLKRWRGRVERVQPFLGPSAPQRCSDELLGGCFAAGSRRGCRARMACGWLETTCNGWPTSAPPSFTIQSAPATIERHRQPAGPAGQRHDCGSGHRRRGQQRQPEYVGGGEAHQHLASGVRPALPMGVGGDGAAVVLGGRGGGAQAANRSGAARLRG